MSEARERTAHPAPMPGSRSDAGSVSDAGGDGGAGTRSVEVPIEDAAPRAESESTIASPGGDGRRPKRVPKSEVVATRLDADGLAKLDKVAASLGGVTRAEAWRRALEIIYANLDDDGSKISQMLQAQRPVVVVADPDQLAQVVTTLTEVATRYGERAREIYAIGHNWNQVSRLANATGDLPTIEVLLNIHDELVRIRQQMNRDAERDYEAMAPLRELRGGT